MTYIGAALLIICLLGMASAAWYWSLKRVERRVSERFDSLAGNFQALDDKLDILQGLLLVIKQDRVLESALEAGRIYREEGLVDEQEIERLTKLIEEMRLENLSRY